jgi:hypothetical protein
LIGTFPLNAANQVALRARLAGSGGVTSATNSGIWVGSPGSVQFIAREGSAAPGVSDGAVFADLHANYFRIALNDSGTLLFHAGLTGAAVNSDNDAGIWRGTSGDLELIVREGDPVPAAPDGIVFGTLSWQPTLTRDGEALFSADLAGAGVTTANDGSIWWADASGELLQIVREGDLFDVDDGPGEDLRTIASAAFASDVGTDNFYPNGQIPLRLSFTSGGGSGIFLATVPEPAIPAAIGLVLFPLLRRRRA